MRVWVLGSGSAGNAVLVESGGTRILIDAGFPVRELAKRLSAIGVSGESIEGAIVTHEHHDHVRGVCAAAKKWKWEVYASTGTIASYPMLKAICARPFSAEPAGSKKATTFESSRKLASVSRCRCSRDCTPPRERKWVK